MSLKAVKAALAQKHKDGKHKELDESEEKEQIQINPFKWNYSSSFIILLQQDDGFSGCSCFCLNKSLSDS